MFLLSGQARLNEKRSGLGAGWEGSALLRPLVCKTTGLDREGSCAVVWDSTVTYIHCRLPFISYIKGKDNLLKVQHSHVSGNFANEKSSHSE